MKTDITELYADAKICEVLQNYFLANNLSGLGDISVTNSDNVTMRHDGQDKTYTPPIRLGTLLDQIKNNHIKDSSLISFNDVTLDTHQGIFTNKSGDQISLTEKEVDILALLHNNKGRVIPRAELLKTIWNYADCVETHTLETHIYRLRQKIEENPADPQILLTKNDGYSLA